MKIFFSKILLTSFFYIVSIWCFAQKSPLKTIIIDPGHGGFDGGAKGSFSTEAQVCLEVSLKFGKALKEAYPDLNIVYTRTRDEMAGGKSNKDEGLKYRARLANESGGNLFISIHCNAAGRKPGGWYEKRVSGYKTVSKKIKVRKKWITKKVQVAEYENTWVANNASGFETYIWAADRTDEKITAVGKANESHGSEMDDESSLELPDPKDPAEKARMLIYTQHFFKKSLELAENVQDEFVKSGRINRGVKQRNDKGIWVLQATGMPSILVELGFVSNTEEEKYLNSESGQKELVDGMVAALKKYKDNIDKKIAEKPADTKRL